MSRPIVIPAKAGIQRRDPGVLVEVRMILMGGKEAERGVVIKTGLADDCVSSDKVIAGRMGSGTCLGAGRHLSTSTWARAAFKCRLNLPLDRWFARDASGSSDARRPEPDTANQ